MISVVVSIKRRPGMSRQEFSDYWRDHHGPLIRNCPEFNRHLASYTQYHMVDCQPHIAAMFGISGDYDGVAVLSFHSEEGMEQAFKEPRYLEVVRPDEPRFVDLERSHSYITEPVSVI